MTILSAYKYLFYRTYVQQAQVLKDSVPKLSALLVVSALLLVNLLTLFMVFKIAIQQNIQFSVLYIVVGAVALGLVNYYFLLHEARFDDILAQFDSETENQKKTRRICCWIYEVGTFAVFFLLAWILSRNPPNM
jgi:archaellum biogenesis protein FlaJ (TadC family)